MLELAEANQENHPAMFANEVSTTHYSKQHLAQLNLGRSWALKSVSASGDWLAEAVFWKIGEAAAQVQETRVQSMQTSEFGFGALRLDRVKRL